MDLLDTQRTVIIAPRRDDAESPGCRSPIGMRLLAAAAAAVITVACGRTSAPPLQSLSSDPNAGGGRGSRTAGDRHPALATEPHSRRSSGRRSCASRSRNPPGQRHRRHLHRRRTARSGSRRCSASTRGGPSSSRSTPREFLGSNAREPWRQPRLQRVVTVAGAPASTLDTVVKQVYPSGRVLPENMLRFYIEFSAPMGRGGPRSSTSVSLTDDGKEVVDPFLPVEAEFWNPERTRFTLFFDPGRVKRGIKPNRDMGRALVAGRRYTLIVSDGLARWARPAAQRGVPAHVHRGPGRRKRRSIRPTWKIAAPTAGTRGPVDGDLSEAARSRPASACSRRQTSEPGAPGSGVGRCR